MGFVLGLEGMVTAENLTELGYNWYPMTSVKHETYQL